MHSREGPSPGVSVLKQRDDRFDKLSGARGSAGDKPRKEPFLVRRYWTVQLQKYIGAGQEDRDIKTKGQNRADLEYLNHETLAIHMRMRYAWAYEDHSQHRQ